MSITAQDMVMKDQDLLRLESDAPRVYKWGQQPYIILNSRSWIIPPLVQLILSTALCKVCNIIPLLWVVSTKLIGFVFSTGITGLWGNLTNLGHWHYPRPFGRGRRLTLALDTSRSTWLFHKRPMLPISWKCREEHDAVIRNTCPYCLSSSKFKPTVSLQHCSNLPMDAGSLVRGRKSKNIYLYPHGQWYNGQIKTAQIHPKQEPGSICNLALTTIPPRMNCNRFSEDLWIPPFFFG